MSLTQNAWQAALEPASFRGVPFAVVEDEIRTCRRVAVHEYPYRDLPWVEDLGRAIQEVRFTAYLVGDDVFDQRDALVRACDQAGPGALVHPSLGRQQASLTSAAFSERAEKQRVVAVRLSFILIGEQLYPNLYPDSSNDTQGACTIEAAETDDAAIGDYSSATSVPLGEGAIVTSAIGTTAAAFGSIASMAVADATRPLAAVRGLAAGLPASLALGRYAAGNLAPVLPAVVAALPPAASTVGFIGSATTALLAAATTARTSVATAAAAMTNAAEAL